MSCACGGAPCDVVVTGPATISTDTEITACHNVLIEPGVSIDPGVNLTLNAGLSVEVSTDFNANLTSKFAIRIRPELACVENLDGDAFNACMDCDDLLSDVYPGAPDSPDGEYLDQNCDGIDGDAENAVFVSKGGVNFAGCGSLESPCFGINYALDRAESLARPEVYVQQGHYYEVIDVRDGRSIFGGFNAVWERSGSVETWITGGQHADGNYTVFRARDVTAVLADLTLAAFNASGQGLLGGRSSYAVHAVNSDLTLARMVIHQGNGAAGFNGNDGTDASSQSAAPGSSGANGAEKSAYCDSTTRKYGGSGATNSSCSSGTGSGHGGDGGRIDTFCGFPFDYDATPGENGTSAAVSLVDSYGWRGNGGAVCGNGINGHDGRTIDGTGGDPGLNSGRIGADNYWYALAGGTGTLGQHGTGGGGGGGGGGCDNGIDDLGAGGGGGGAGGCRALAAGSGGTGGGGSFGVFAVSSLLDISNVSFDRGYGGDGGNGGEGGSGQLGGGKGSGGTGSDGSGDGGDGGAGGRGGHAGGGGGGAGGSAYCIYHFDSVVTASSNDCLGGQAGDGGAGGSGAIVGQQGESGQLGNTGECLSKGNCDS